MVNHREAAGRKRGLSLGGLALLAGCDLSTHSGVDAALWAMLRFDDRVQAALFSRRRFAQTYPVSAVTKPFRFNAYYEEWQVRDVPADWRLEVSGLVADKAPWTLEKLRSLPIEAQVTRHICIEGWSQIGQWSGVPLHVFLQRVGADLRARYVSFKMTAAKSWVAGPSPAMTHGQPDGSIFSSRGISPWLPPRRASAFTPRSDGRKAAAHLREKAFQSGMMRTGSSTRLPGAMTTASLGCPASLTEVGA
jgi:hypothetical protein